MTSLLVLIIGGSWFSLAAGHAYLLEPPSRNVRASKASKEPCPHCLQSGGPEAVKSRSKGVWPTVLDPESHGLCGDPVQGTKDPLSIFSETYLNPSSDKRTYRAGDVVEFRVGVSTHHQGHYEFRLCTRSLDKNLQSKQAGQDCLNEHVLVRAERSPSCGTDVSGDCQYINPKHPERWYLPPAGSSTPVADKNWDDAEGLRPYSPNDEVHVMRYVIPQDVTCEHCTLQWYYATGNTCGYDADYLIFDPGFKFWQFYKETWANAKNAICGPDGSGHFAEEFWNCADIQVLPSSDRSADDPLPKTAITTSLASSSTGKTTATTTSFAPHSTSSSSSEQVLPSSDSSSDDPLPKTAITTSLASSSTGKTTATTTSFAPASTSSSSSEQAPSTASSGSCRNPVCGCPPFEGGAFWCREHNSMYGPWCQKSANNCKTCGAVWCEAPSLTKSIGKKLRGGK